MLSQDSEQDEREQIQDDIERLQLALQEEEEYEGSDDENVLRINQDYATDFDGSLHPKPGPSGINTNYQDEQAEEGEEPGDGQMDIGDFAQMQMMGDDGEIVINPETCLALNRAYQEILLDLLRKVEISLQENRSKQTTLEEELTVKSNKKNASSSDPNSSIKPLAAFGVPFFRDVNGRHAPQNEDVRLKKTLGEIRQDNINPVLWYRGQRELLTEAVHREAQEKLIRPLMNRKEVEAEKHLLADKNKKSKVKKEIEANLEEIDAEIEAIRHYSLEDMLEQLDADDIDWMKISNIDFFGKHGPGDCKKFWVNVLQPKINKDKWVPEERDLLQELVIKHEMKNWDLIAKELGTNRSAYQCLQYYQQNLNVNFSTREWTQEEDELLKEVVENCRVANRISWNQVCYFIEGRNWTQCQRRWMQIDPASKRGRWSAEEDCLLLSAVHLHGTANWKLIKEMVPGRNAYQCRDRYTNCLDPSLKPPTTWTYEEDKKLLKLANKYSTEDSSTISWTKVAAELEGRTDNMVLARYKRLKSWKIRSDWLKTQNADTKKYLGTMCNKNGDQENPEVPASGFDISCLGAFASNEQRNDYLKQIRDEQAGDIVVPRPPLSYRFTTRNMEMVWQRKLQLKRLVEHHLQKTMAKSATSQDKMFLPSKTAKEFVPFGDLTKRQQLEMNDLFKNKDPCTVTVSEMLAITKNFKTRGRPPKNQGRKFDKDHRIESKMADIVQMKNYMSMITRTSAGRPKKFYIFHPNGKPPTKEVPENTTQLTSVSTTLMLSALEVNGHQALQNAQRIPEDKMSQSEKENLTMLKKLFPPMPASMRAKSVQGQKVTFPGTAVQGPSSATKAVDSLQGLTVSVQKAIPQTQSTGDSSSGSKGVKTVTIVQSTAPRGPQTSVQRSSVPLMGNTPSPQLTALKAGAGSQHSDKQTVASQRQSSSSSASVGPKGSVASVSTTDQQLRSGNVPVSSSSGRNSGITGQISQPSRVVVVQKQGAPTPSNIPLLPPGVKNLEGFAGLLIQCQLLTASAGSTYNEKYYQNISKKRSSLIPPEYMEDKEDENQIKNMLDSFKNSSSAAIMRGAKCMNQSSFTKDNSENTSLRDPLSDIRHTPAYRLLKKRFEGLFAWPALLSTVAVGDLKPKQGFSRQISGKRARIDQRKKAEEIKPPPPEPDVDTKDLMDAGEKAFAAMVRNVMVKKKRKRYACANGRFFYRNQLMDKDYRQHIIRKRMVAKRLNRELREQGISVNDLNTKSRPLKKRLHPTRQSSRLAKKVEVVEPEPQVQAEKSDISETVKHKKLDQTPQGDEMAKSQRSKKDRIKNKKVNRNVKSQGQPSNPGVFSPYIIEQENATEDGISNDSENNSGVYDQSDNGVVSKEKLEPIVKGKTSRKSSEQKPQGPSVSKKRKTEKTGNSDGDSPIVGLQASTTTGPFTVFPGMGTPSSQKPNPVQFMSSPVALGGLSPMTTVSASDVATPFTHPEFAGHVLFAIPVDQLAQSSSLVSQGSPQPEGVIPLTLLINTNNLPFSSPVRTNQNTENPSSTNQNPESQIPESATSNQQAESVVIEETTESAVDNQAIEKQDN